MRTKVLCAAALAAGALTSMAQVYSANVVGYVNVPLAGYGSYNLIANPLDATMGGTVAGGNNITNLFAGTAVKNGDQIFRWNVANFDFDTAVSTKGPSGWSPKFDLNPGEAVFYITGASSPDGTITFVGQVNQGAWTYPGALGGTANTVAGYGSYNAISAPFPTGGSFTNAIPGLVARNGDQVFTWSVPDFDFSTVVATKGPSGWSHTEVQVAPGVGLFYIPGASSPDQVWTANFTVQ